MTETSFHFSQKLLRIQEGDFNQIRTFTLCVYLGMLHAYRRKTPSQFQLDFDFKRSPRPWISGSELVFLLPSQFLLTSSLPLPFAENWCRVGASCGTVRYEYVPVSTAVKAKERQQQEIRRGGAYRQATTTLQARS